MLSKILLNWLSKFLLNTLCCMLWSSRWVLIHMLYHKYVVQSADARANLSSIEITWCLGKNCTSVGTVHIIDPWVSICRSLSIIDPHVRWVSIPHAVSHVCCAAERRCSCKSLLHWNHMVFGQELHERWHCSYHWSLSIDPHARWVWSSIHMFIEYDRSTCWSTCMLCRVPTLVQISPPLKSYGVWARIVRASQLMMLCWVKFYSMCWVMLSKV
jgi:hypothetical protein